MSQAYTPGLKRKELYLVTKTRRLPIPGEVLVKKGDRVSIDTIVARAKIPGDPNIVNVAGILGVDPNEIEKYMVKKIGDNVKKGEPIARYRAFFGLIKSDCLSPVDGTIESISGITGRVIIREPPVPIELDAYIPGKVIDIIPNEGVVIQTPAAFIQGAFGVGGETHGEIMMMSKKTEDILTAEQITSECKDKILVTGSLVTAEALKKAVEMGVKGVVVGGIMDKDLSEFLGYTIGVAITGHEKIGLTIVATEGFGAMRMLEKTFKILQKHEGEIACINGATQIRAGVIRPEVIIPITSSDKITTSLETDRDLFTGGLKPGTLVRIIQEPYFGQIGKVYSLPPELQFIETESKVRVVEVELEDGRRVIVPRANVEIIEE